MKIKLLTTLLLTLLISPWVQANCVRNVGVAGYDAYGMNVGIGNINITDNYIQPPGTIIASSVVTYAPGFSYPSPDTVIYTCDKTDIGNIFEMFATNGDDRVGGFFPIGTEDGLTNFYQTRIQYTGIRLTHLNSGQPFLRTWQQFPITSYLEDGTKIKIRAKDFSAIKVEIAKVSSAGYATGGASNFCGGWQGVGAYTCPQPNGYVAFKGPGLGSFPAVGSDSAYNYVGFPTHWTSIGLGTPPRTNLTKNATCVARNVTPVVLFPTISVTDLNQGKVVQGNFTVTVECSSSVISGTATGQTAIGIQTSQAAYQTAQSLGLVNAKGGVSYLLSDGYGVDTTIATGVGISLRAPNGQELPFVGWQNCNGSGSISLCPGGLDAGWFPILTGANGAGDSAQPGYKYFTNQFTATLQKIPSQTVTAGRIQAKGYVLVRVQ